MNKLNKSQNGFSTVELVIIVFIVALVVAVGYLVYKDHHKTADVSAVNISVPSDWIRYENANGGFSVYFPTSPIVIPSDSTDRVTQIQSISSATSIYRVAFINYGNSSPPSGISGLNNNIPVSESQYQNGHLVISKYSNVNGVESEKFTLTGIYKGDKVYVNGEIIRTKQYLYDVLASYNGNTENSNSYSNDFINSFKLGS